MELQALLDDWVFSIGYKDGKDSEGGWMGTTQVGLRVNGKTQKHLLHFAHSVQKEVAFVVYSYRGSKVNLF